MEPVAVVTKESIFTGLFWIWLFLASVAMFTLFIPFLARAFNPVESFVTNGRQTGPPTITVLDGELVYGQEGNHAAGSPRVYPDWLVHREFYDDRAVFFYKDTPLGEPVCAIDVPNPEGGFRNRAGVPYPGPPRAGEPHTLEGSFSLDQWTGYRLREECPLTPGKYAMVTEYRVRIWTFFITTFRFTSNIFTIKEPRH